MMPRANYNSAVTLLVYKWKEFSTKFLSEPKYGILYNLPCKAFRSLDMMTVHCRLNVTNPPC
jgi:hypothetical protein